VYNCGKKKKRMGNVKSEIPVGKIEGRKLLRTSRCI
jgi:hypothetical protein